ncbi:MAG: PorT family protein [Chlorobi bacterium]|nr:PorT family protein [Chlorobiota bacterium]
MKKIFFNLSLFLFLIISQASGQYIRYGITGGINKCGLFGIDKPTTFNKQLGYFGGLYIDNKISENLSVQSELNFSQFRFKFSEQVPLIENSNLSIDEKDYFISVPVFLKFKKGYEFIFWHIGLGGKISVLAKSKKDLSLKVGNYDTDPTYYYNYKNNWYEYGFTGNAGIQFKAIDLFVRYYISMRNIYKSSQARNMSYNNVAFGVSWQFNYKELYPYGRKAGWRGLKYKITHLFK